MNGHSVVPRGGLAPFDLYPYNPSKPAGWAFVVIFGICAICHFIYMFPLRAWFFIPFTLGCVGEAFGYYGRAWSHDNIRLGGPYLLQLMLILGSAPLLAATIYMTLGRFVRSLRAQKHTIMRSTWITKIYVLIDIGSFVCQMMGSAMQGSGDAKGVELGQRIVIGGLIVQLVALAWFFIECTILHRRLQQNPTFVSRNPLVHWQRSFWTLHSVTLLVFVRSLFRLIEFFGGSDGHLASHEAYLYVFDASLLSFAAILFALIHPGRLLKFIRELDLGDFEDSAVMLD